MQEPKRTRCSWLTCSVDFEGMGINSGSSLYSSGVATPGSVQRPAQRLCPIATEWKAGSKAQAFTAVLYRLKGREIYIGAARS
ncbi:hypothetical protein CapIbe_005371 [Capra ibex]